MTKTWDFICPNCDHEEEADIFSDEHHCSNCNAGFETDWDYPTHDSLAAWIVGPKQQEEE